MRLENKIALITGGTSGIGLATAKLFLEEGAEVIITGKNTVISLEELMGNMNNKLHFFSYDSSKMEDVDKLRDYINHKFGRLDIAFINAGIAKFAAIEEVSENLFDEVVNVNFKGVYFTLQKLSPLLDTNASVVLTASSGIHKSHLGSSLYSATKAAIRNLAISLSGEWVKRGIRINVISPGSTDTALLGKLGVEGDDLEQMKAHLVANIPQGRLVLAEEIAQAVLYLAAPGSESQTGTEIIVDGGAFVKV